MQPVDDAIKTISIIRERENLIKSFVFFAQIVLTLLKKAFLNHRFRENVKLMEKQRIFFAELSKYFRKV